MSVQAGAWNFDGAPVAPELLAELSELSKVCGPDGEKVWREGPVGMIYRPFHTTRESWLEQQPVHSRAGYVLTWDGRLDNREELVPRLLDSLCNDFTDAAIVMAAIERWGPAEAFKQLAGDWALSLWDPKDQRLILARDFSGTRELYYRIATDRVIWATRLEALLLSCGEQFDLCEEYVTRYFASTRSAHLTPYAGVLNVPPGSCVAIKNRQSVVTSFWAFDPSHTLQCSDADYDEAFRCFLSQAVRRRLRAADPVMAELSGGVDTGCIVSVADRLIGSGLAETRRLETISYYVPDEPNWDEMPYVRIMEQARKAEGLHVECGSNLQVTPFRHGILVPLPGATQARFDLSETVSHAIRGNDCRVVLSGTGGDEMTGGRPNPSPELLDLLRQGRLIRFVEQMRKWGVALRMGVSQLLGVMGQTAFARLEARADEAKLPQWVSPRVRKSIRGLVEEERRSGEAHSYEKAVTLLTISHLAGQNCAHAMAGPCLEKRFPMMDRDFIQFLLSVPRDQMQRPGRRRALLRRAMTGIVPRDILERKRKAFLEVRPQRAIAESPFYGMCPMLAELAWIDAGAYQEAAHLAASGVSEARLGLQQAMVLEAWLDSELPQRFVRGLGAIAPHRVSTSSAEATRRILRKEVNAS